MVCRLFGDSLEIGSRGEGLRGLWNMKQKVVWPPQSTVSGLRDFRRMLTSIWKILHGTICMLAKLRFSPSENIYLGGKKGKKETESIYSNAILSFNMLWMWFLSFWDLWDSSGVSDSIPQLSAFGFKVVMRWMSRASWYQILRIRNISGSCGIKSSMHQCLMVTALW